MAKPQFSDSFGDTFMSKNFQTLENVNFDNFEFMPEFDFDSFFTKIDAAAAAPSAAEKASERGMYEICTVLR